MRNVDLTVGEGELAVVAGPTGTGKSTLLGCVAGLVPHFTGGVVHGRVVVGGRDTRTHRPGDLADLIGYVGQDPAAGFVTDTVEDEVAYGLECLGTAQPVMRRRVEDALDLLSLAALRSRRLRGLSGGERQRVAIAAVLATGSRVLVLDEPTSALDPGGAEDVLAAVHRLVHDLGVTVLMTEHRLERALQFADQLVLVEDGRVLAGEPSLLMEVSAVRPPVVELARLAGWSPPPVTVRDARRRADRLRHDLAAAPPSSPREPAPGPPPAPGRVRIRGLTVRRGRRQVLHDADLDIPAGVVVALMGRNGAGKSTLLSASAGLVAREGGVVDVDGADPADLPAQQAIRLVGLVPDDPRLLLRASSVADECVGADDDTGVTPGATRRMLARIAPGLAGAHRVNHHPDDLSEGERLTLAMAVILTAGPSLLLLDEPTRGLDYAAKSRLSAMLRSFAASGLAVVVATHDVEFVADVADRVVTMAGGRIVAEGPAADVLLSSYVHTPQVAKVLRPHRWLTVGAVASAMKGEG
nr:ABC transporter ATP-binding protein [Phytoactinopolyspora alkaliphila]